MNRVWTWGLAAALLLTAAGPGGAEDQPPPGIDLQLVLAVDVSRSIDDDEYALQREGYAQAITHPAVVGAIQGNQHHRIVVTLFEWSSVEQQRILVPWMVIQDAETAEIFAERLRRASRAFAGWTSISGAIGYGLRLIEDSPLQGDRKVIDISGDGVNNSGGLPGALRDEAVRRGVTVNGLVIENDRPTPGFFQAVPQPALDQYYRDHVIGGSGAFVMAIKDFESFAHAIVNKLIKEIAGIDVASSSGFALWVDRPE